MKELTIEQKAKRYGEALERARAINNGETTGALGETVCEFIFPELKESEDEKIRKAILALVRQSSEVLDKQNQNNMIAWLEKQGTPSKLSEEEQNRFAKGVLTSCAMSFINYLDAHKHEGKMCVSNGECEDIENAFQNAMWDRLHRYYCKYIEKQGEQKPAWSEEDNMMIEETLYFLREYQQSNRCKDENGMQNSVTCREWLKSLKNGFGCEANCTTIKEWSVEDKSKVQRICEYLDEAKKYYADITEVRECMDWLKSLEQRIGK